MQALLEFAFLPTRYIESSWLQYLPQSGLLQKLRDCKRVEAALSKYILEHFQLSAEDCVHWFDNARHEHGLPESITHLIAMPATDIQRLVYYLGACVNERAIRLCLDGQQVRAAKSRVGEAVYLFGLKRAPYIIGQLNLPSVSIPSNIDLGASIQQCGILCLLTAIDDYGDAFKQRLLFKLPYAWSESDTINTPLGFSTSQCQALIEQVYSEIIESER